MPSHATRYHTEMMGVLEDPGIPDIPIPDVDMTETSKETFSVAGEEIEIVDEERFLLGIEKDIIQKKAPTTRKAAGNAGNKVAAKGKRVLSKHAGKKVVVRKRAATLAAKVAGKAPELKPAAEKVVARKGRNATLAAKKATTLVRKKVPIRKKILF